MAERDDREIRDEEVADEPILTNEKLFKELSTLMKDKGFLIEVAEACDKAYKQSEIDRLTREGEPVDEWLLDDLFTESEREVILKGPSESNPSQQEVYKIARVKYAMALGGFYALTDGLGFLSSGVENPYHAHETLKSIGNGSADDVIKNVMSRFAHATWAAGQPFRDRETRDVMMPWDLLSENEKTKDMIQITAAARVLDIRLSSQTPAN